MGLSLQKMVFRSKLPARVRFLATVLAHYGDNDGTNIFPCIETLAANMGVKRDAVLRGLKLLKQLGVLVVESPGGGAGRATRYRMIPEALAAPVNRSPDAAVCEPESRSVGATVPVKTVASALRGRQNSSVGAIQNSSADATRTASTYCQYEVPPTKDTALSVRRAAPSAPHACEDVFAIKGAETT